MHGRWAAPSNAVCRIGAGRSNESISHTPPRLPPVAVGNPSKVGNCRPIQYLSLFAPYRSVQKRTVAAGFLQVPAYSYPDSGRFSTYIARQLAAEDAEVAELSFFSPKG